MQHAVNVRPVRIRQDAPELGCDRLRGVGYRPVCSCGWRGSVTSTHRQARAEGKWHSGSEQSESDQATRTTPAG